MRGSHRPGCIINLYPDLPPVTERVSCRMNGWVVRIFGETNLVLPEEFEKDCLLSYALTLLNQNSVLSAIMQGVSCKTGSVGWFLYL